MERSYRNLGYVLLILLPMFVAGFWIPYFLEIPHFDETITMAVHVHAASLFCFLLLLIVQPLAIRYKAFSTHRVLGKFSNILIPIALVSSVAMLWKEYHEHLTDGATIGMARTPSFCPLPNFCFLAVCMLYQSPRSVGAMSRRTCDA